MTNIFNKVVDAIIMNSELTAALMLVKFLYHPAAPLKSSASQHATQPDGYLVLKKRLQEKSVSWANILLPCEYKWKDRDVNLYDVSI